MYKWNIDITLKSGTTVNCEYTGPENNSNDAIVKLFKGKQPTDWLGFGSHNGTHQVFVVCGEIAAVDIYERK